MSCRHLYLVRHLLRAPTPLRQWSRSENVEALMGKCRDRRHFLCGCLSAAFASTPLPASLAAGEALPDGLELAAHALSLSDEQFVAGVAAVKARQFKMAIEKISAALLTACGGI